MTTQLTARAASFGLAVLMTLAILGSVDFLATSEPAANAALLAAAAAPRV